MSRQPAQTLHIEAIADGTVRISGDLDLGTAPQLHAALADALAADPDRLVLDVTALGFCDSAGLAALVRTAGHLPTQDQLVLHGASDQLRQLLRITNLDSAFTLT